MIRQSLVVQSNRPENRKSRVSLAALSGLLIPSRQFDPEVSFPIWVRNCLSAIPVAEFHRSGTLASLQWTEAHFGEVARQSRPKSFPTEPTGR